MSFYIETEDERRLSEILEAWNAETAVLIEQRAALLIALATAIRFLSEQGYDEPYCNTHGLTIRRDLTAAIAKIIAPEDSR